MVEIRLWNHPDLSELILQTGEHIPSPAMQLGWRQHVDVGRKFDPRVKPDTTWVGLLSVAFDAHQVEIPDAGSTRRLPPDVGGPFRLRQKLGSIHQKQRLAVDSDVPFIFK